MHHPKLQVLYIGLLEVCGGDCAHSSAPAICSCQRIKIVISVIRARLVWKIGHVKGALHGGLTLNHIGLWINLGYKHTPHAVVI